MRLARTYEEVRGRDLAGFLGFLRDQEALGAAQLEAVSEEEGCGRRAAADDPRREGARVQGRRRRRRRSRARRARPGRTRSSRSPTAGSGSRSSIPSRASAKAVFGYERGARVPGARPARAERLRLYYVAMTRAIDRLLVSGRARREPRHADRLGAVEARLRGGAASGRRAVRAPARRRLVPRPRRPPGRAGRRAGAAAEDAGGAGQLSLFAELPVDAARCAAGALPELEPRAAAAAAPRAAALVLGARALRALLVPLLRRAGRRPARAARRRRPRTAGLAATEIGDAVHRLLEQIDLARRRGCPTSRSFASWYPAVTDEELERIAAFAAAVLRLRARAARRRARRRAARAAVRVRARRRAAARPARRPPPRRRAGAGRRLQDERRSATARRRRSSSRTTRSSGSSTRSPASAPATRRSRSSTCSSSGPTRSCRRRSRAADLPALEAELSAAIDRIDAGEFVPTPGEFTCSGCPALDLVCAGPRGRSGSPAGGRRPGAGSRCGRAASPRWRAATSTRRGSGSARSARGSGPVIERLAVEHADAGSRSRSGARSSCSSR